VRWRDVQHQDRALAVLRRALRSGRTPHAYLFEGPEGVGKEMAAQALAARLLCTAAGPADAEACGSCASCRLLAVDTERHGLASGNHPDFHLIHRGLHKLHPDRAVRAARGLFLAVDLVRHFLIEPAASKPTIGPRRVFLIRDAERMNEEAQNALLKTLEEPPGQTVLILVTASAERLLPTIRSRCQRVPFGLLPRAFMEEQLARTGADPAAARALAVLAAGRLGAALRWQQLGLLGALDQVAGGLAALSAGDPESFAGRMLEIAGGLAVQRAAATEAEGEQATEEEETPEQDESPRAAARTIPTDLLREGIKLVLLLVAALYRDALVAAAGAAPARQLLRWTAATDALARGRSAEALEAGVTAAVDAERMVDQNVAPQLALEHVAVVLRGGR
jgi:DNA polymerase III delta' subunit